MRTARILRLAAVSALVALLPHSADPGTCANPAARDLLVTSYTDALLNRPKGEDTNFFTRAGGVPNIMVLLDTSGSMNRLPPDGPSYFGAPLPPGYKVTNPTTTGTAAGTQGAAYNANSTTAAPNTRIVGCGLDPVSAGSAAFTGSRMYQILSARRFSPPCNNAVNPALVGDVYQGHAIDYADQMKVCPYFTSSNNQAVGAPGFDPDYYLAPTDPMATSAGGELNLFGRNLVFHDNPNMNASWARSTTLAFGHNFGDGFYYGGLAPHLDKATGNKSTIASFCAQQGTAAPRVQGGLTHADICTQCLTTKGWYYDGVILNGGENNADLPSLWYTGNYLNFFPPKFVIARKVLKDIIAVQSRVRMAMARFDGTGATFFQPFNPTCGMPENSSFDSNRASYVSSIDGLAFSGGTPMAVALFDVGRYYHSPDLPWFGSTWENSTKESAANANQAAVCYSCQTSSVILITDGQPSSNDGNSLPGNPLTAADLTSTKYAGDVTTGIRNITSAVCPKCLPFTAAADLYKNNVPKTAFYLHNMDLRKNNETTLDCMGQGGKQVLDVYTIGFATSTIPGINSLLASTAEVGGGIFVPAEDTRALKEGFNAILEEINGRSTSFSVATVSTLQTTSGRSVIVPRFDPSKSATWRGHLFRYDLYSEFVNLCTPNSATDYNCDGRCDGVFLQDLDGDFISEDGNGAFVKNDPPNQPVCLQAPRCGAACSVPGTGEANAYWNAAEAWGDLPLPPTSFTWSRRNVWTAIDSDGDGDVDGDDEMVKLDTSNPAAATKLLPYLGLGGGTVCNTLAGRFSAAGDLASAALVAANPLECAQSILRYVLGADLFNEQGVKTGYPAASQQALWDRPFLLGDIFHSSPVVVEPPSPRKGVLAEAGLAPQTLIALWDTPTLDGAEGWDEFSLDPLYKDRRKVVLVGANDGMLHAFSDSVFCEGADDNRTTDLDESALGGYYEPRTDLSVIQAGTTAGPKCNRANENTELWGFIPPDLLAKLPLLTGSEHHFYVDGSPMVRNVWVDGSDNGLPGTGSRNDRKEGNEFHTMVVVGERRGGTRYFALDITDATEPGTVPKFRWIFPQPNDPRSLYFGETYGDPTPTPPPIGPVRIAADAGSPAVAGVTPEYKFDGSNTPYHERWVAFLNGGFDPQYLRGRGVHMVDVWTGKELWDFSYPANPASLAADDPRLQLRFPVAAAVGMVRWGTESKFPDAFTPADNFFDTATFGDTGGQAWTLRFHLPGRLGADGKVTNWFGARLFQMGGQTSCKLCGGQPFFHITANGPTGSDHVFRTYLGTGDRFNLTDRYGGQCAPNNIRACVLRGCTVTLDAAANQLSSPGPGFARAGLSQAACNALTSTSAAGTTAACSVDGSVKVVISNCPSPEPNNGPTTTTREARVTCTEQANGYECTRSLDVPGVALTLSETSNAPNLGNWFFSLLVFRDGTAADPLSKPVFKTAAEAKVYDSHRSWITQAGTTRNASSGLVLIDSTSTAPATLATDQSAGWAIYYNHGPTVTIDSTSVNVNWMDERTASGTAYGAGLVSWNTVQPPTSTVISTSPSCRVSKCKQEDRRINYLYGADPVSGGLHGAFLDSSGNSVRSLASYRLVPAQALQSTVFVNKKGQVQQALTGVSPEQGAINVGASAAEDPITESGVLLIDRELYDCRHASSPTCR